jgi:hypothetical protein
MLRAPTGLKAPRLRGFAGPSGLANLFNLVTARPRRSPGPEGSAKRADPVRRARVLSVLGLFPLLLLSPVLADDSAKPKKPGGCVDVRTDASFASVGYDHIVTLKSACKKAVVCSVRTNVNPEAAQLKLDPGEEKSVVTWRGSPAREFTADVSCN